MMATNKQYKIGTSLASTKIIEQNNSPENEWLLILHLIRRTWTIPQPCFNTHEEFNTN